MVLLKELGILLAFLSGLTPVKAGHAGESDNPRSLLNSFVASCQGGTIPFDPFEFYGISAASGVDSKVQSKIILKPSDVEAYRLLCTSATVQVGATSLDTAALKQNTALCAKFEDSKSVLGHAISNGVPIIGRIFSKSHASDPWVTKCTSLCAANGNAGDWCSTMCNMQANNDDGQTGPPDPLVVSACETFKKNQFAGALPTESVRMHPRLKNTIYNDGQSCRAVVFLLQDYDWQKPIQQADSGCKPGSKPNTVNFAYNQCIVVNSVTPLSIRYFDGPSIAHTSEAIHAIAKYPETILEIAGMLVAIPPIYSALLGVGEDALAAVLAKYTELFWWSGVAHDFCYHNGLNGHGYDKMACDKAFRTDNLEICRTSGQGPLLDHNCEAWAELFYFILRFNLTDVSIPGYGKLTLSFSQSSWEASNYGYNYQLIDVAGASGQQKAPAIVKVTPKAPQSSQTVEINLTVLGQDKAPSSIGLISLHFSNGQTIGQFSIDKQEWHAGSVHVFSAGVLSEIALSDFQSLSAFVSMDFRTQGKDRLEFDVQVTMRLDNLGRVQQVFKSQQVGHCGSGCVLGVCPKNDCSYTSPSFSIASMTKVLP